MSEQIWEQRKFDTPVIRVDQAQEVGSAVLADELLKFRSQPTENSLNLLLKRSLEHAYPWINDHQLLLDRLDLDDVRNVDETKQFPAFPLSKLPAVEHELVDALSHIAYPGNRVGRQLARLFARSDSALAHDALADHIIVPFPKEQSNSKNDGTESHYKVDLLMYMFTVVNKIGSPDTNPHLVRTISTVYGGIREGSPFFEQQKAKEVSAPHEFHGIATWELRNMQEWILSSCLESKHTAFDSLVEEVLAEPVDARRMATAVDVFGHRRHNIARTDGFNERVMEHIAGEFNPATIQLLLNIAGSSDTVLTHPNRGWRRQLVHTVIETEKQKEDPNSKLIHAALWLYPIKQELYARDREGNHTWPKDDKFQEDIAYMADLLRDPNMRHLQDLITHHLAANDSRFHSYTSRPSAAHVGRIYNIVIEAIMSKDTEDYAAITANRATRGALRELSNLMKRTERPLSEVPTEELRSLLDCWDAYQEYDRGDNSREYNRKPFLAALEPLLKELRRRG